MPTVTSLEKIKRLKGWFELTLDKLSSFPVNDELIIKFNIKIGVQFLPHEIKEIRERGEYLYTKRKAFDILSRRRYSEKDLRDKLTKSLTKKEYIEQVISELKELKFIDDMEYANSMIHSIGLTGKRSVRYIRDKLYHKGVPDEVIDKAIESELGDYDESEIAYNLAVKKHATLAKLPTLKAKKRVADFLKGRGFNWEDIKYALDRVFTEDQ